jgi:hypothetical protein
MKKKLFLTFSACIYSFTIIFICTAPIVNWDIIGASFWRDDICGEKEYLCRSKKAMYYLEYLAASFDIVFGFICSVLGFLHLFEFSISKIKSCVIGVLGFISACIIFVITTIYLCFSGYIFVNAEAKNYDNGYSSDKLLKTNEDGAFAEYNYGNYGMNNYYKYIYYDEADKDKLVVKYKDLGKKQYNYQRKIKFAPYDSDFKVCRDKNIYDFFCKSSNKYYNRNNNYYDYYNNYYYYYGKNCRYLYSNFEGFENKYVYDRWLTTIIISCLIILSSIGLAIFGILLIKE